MEWDVKKDEAVRTNYTEVREQQIARRQAWDAVDDDIRAWLEAREAEAAVEAFESI